MADSYKGEITILSYDLKSNQAAINIKISSLMFQILAPLLANTGTIDNHKISEPVTVQLPDLAVTDFKEEYLRSISNFPQHVAELLKLKTRALVEAYDEIKISMKDPDLLVAILPMSVVVEFRYRFDIDGLKQLINNLSNVTNPALIDFRNGLSATIKEIEKSLS